MVSLNCHDSVFTVLKPRWVKVVICLCFVCTSFARSNIHVQGDDPLSRHGPDRTDQQLRMSCMMFTYVMSKGCDYVMAFVKGHYYANSHHADDNHRYAPPRNCDWRPWIERKCHDYHVPSELCCALMDCGASPSMTALGSPTEKCNVTYTLGKRTSRLCQAAPSTNYMCQVGSTFGKRSYALQPAERLHVSNRTELPQTIFQKPRLNTTVMTDSIVRPVSSLNVAQARLPLLNKHASSEKRQEVQKWCKSFSRKVNKKYHLNEVKFVRQSVYWLVDIYKAAKRHRVPKPYTHGLVGCGMEYAMLAFNVKKWQTVLYSHALL